MKFNRLWFLLLPLFINAQAPLPTIWNFSTPGIATPPAGWTTGLGTNGNLTYSGAANSVGGDNISCRLDATGEFLTIWFADKPGPLSYWMRGTGISPNPAFTGTFSIQESVNGTNWTPLRTFTTANPVAGTMTRYVDNPSASARYVRFFYSAKEANSNIALDSVLIQAAPASPNATIQLKQGNTVVVNGGTYIVGNNASTVFTIENKGTAEALTINSVSFVGDDAADFNVLPYPTSIPANSSADMTITFNPANLGSHIVVMNVESNDIEKQFYGVVLYGIGGNLATQPTAQPTQFRVSNLQPYTFSLGVAQPNPKPERIIVLRKPNAAITEIPVDGRSYTKGDYIGQSQVAYIGSDTGFKPTYIMANSAYHFAAFSVNGPAGFENYLTQNPLRTTVTTPGNNIGNYYNGISGSNANLVSALSAKTNPHDTVFYSQYIGTIINNFLTRDTTAGKKVVNCVYTSNPYIYNEPFLWWTGTNSGILTREHTYAQSWMPSNKGGTWPNAANGRELPEFNDLHNLFPADQELGNVKRSNLPFGEIVGNPTYVSPTGQGKIGLDANGNEVYEPRDAQKGDLARALFYMCIAYNGIGGNNWSLGSVVAANQNQEVLKKWHFQDLPDAYEIARHEYIFALQKNRNPFIDSVNFACRVNFSNLTWIAEPPANCGIEAQPSLVLTAPNGGETWRITTANDSFLISWNATIIDTVKIELVINDTNTVLLGKVASNNLSTYIRLAETTPSTNFAKIKLNNEATGLISQSLNYFTIDNATGFKENGLAQSALQLFPNPSKGSTLLLLNNIELAQTTITITDISGRVVQKVNAAKEMQLNVVKPGIYFVSVSSPKGSITKKWLVTAL